MLFVAHFSIFTEFIILLARETVIFLLLYIYADAEIRYR